MLRPSRPLRLILLALFWERHVGLWDLIVAVPAAHFLFVGRPALSIAIAAVWLVGTIAGELALRTAKSAYSARAFGRPLPLDPRKPR